MAYVCHTENWDGKKFWKVGDYITDAMAAARGANITYFTAGVSMPVKGPRFSQTTEDLVVITTDPQVVTFYHKLSSRALSVEAWLHEGADIWTAIGVHNVQAVGHNIGRFTVIAMPAGSLVRFVAVGRS